VNPHDFDSIPQIDFQLPPEILLPQLRQACEEIGFFYAVNHSVPDELMDAMFTKSQEFFQLPQATKDGFLQDGDVMAGYFGKGMENMDCVKDVSDRKEQGATGPKKLDNKEGFDMNGSVGGLSHEENQSSTSYRWTQNTKLPGDGMVDGFQATMKEYQQAVSALGLEVLDLIGQALELKNPAILKSACEGKGVSHHRILHYPPLADYHKEVSIGAHVDYGFITMLCQDQVGGLQVLNSKKSQWVHAPPIKHAFIINFGSMLAQWTNNRVKATVHRVVNLTTQERYSSPYFLRPSLNTNLNPSHVDETLRDEDVSCEEVLTGFYSRADLLKK
jgi:isopenicillin N synthase-like dioxygenase